MGKHNRAIIVLEKMSGYIYQGQRFWKGRPKEASGEVLEHCMNIMDPFNYAECAFRVVQYLDDPKPAPTPEPTREPEKPKGRSVAENLIS